MANNYFKFKQFTVYQEHCSMKVGTDGVMLGAWVDINTASHILDIGTGTGLIALMLAQRNSISNIDAIDIDTKSVKQAKENIEASPWSDRIRVTCRALQDYNPQNNRYDLIVANPPFFSNSLHAASKSRTRARHNDSLLPEELAENVARLINTNGIFALIYPSETFSVIEQHIYQAGMKPKRICKVKPTPYKAPKRVMAEFTKGHKEPCHETIIVEKYGRHGYSEEYRTLCKEYLLNF